MSYQVARDMGHGSYCTICISCTGVVYSEYKFLSTCTPVHEIWLRKYTVPVPAHEHPQCTRTRARPLRLCEKVTRLPVPIPDL